MNVVTFVTNSESSEHLNYIMRFKGRQREANYAEKNHNNWIYNFINNCFIKWMCG